MLTIMPTGLWTEQNMYGPAYKNSSEQIEFEILMGGRFITELSLM